MLELCEAAEKENIQGKYLKFEVQCLSRFA